MILTVVSARNKSEASGGGISEGPETHAVSFPAEPSGHVEFVMIDEFKSKNPNAPARLAEPSFLAKYFDQEGYIVSSEDNQSLTAFKCIVTDYSRIIDGLSVLVSLHNLILNWSEE